MNDLEELALIKHRKSANFSLLGLQNSYGLTVTEAEAQSVAYELARAEMWKADADLIKAQKEFAGEVE